MIYVAVKLYYILEQCKIQPCPSSFSLILWKDCETLWVQILLQFFAHVKTLKTNTKNKLCKIISQLSNQIQFYWLESDITPLDGDRLIKSWVTICSCRNLPVVWYSQFNSIQFYLCKSQIYINCTSQQQMSQGAL